MDGNKRTGVSSGAYLLSIFGFELTVTNDALEDFAVDVATGDLTLEEMVRWFEEHARRG